VHVAADGSFSIVALVWLPGQATPIHSHRSWCVVGVHEGRELETTYHLARPPGAGLLEVAGASEMTAGQVTSITGTTAIHGVENNGSSTAVSLHVYGLDYRLGSSIRRVFTPSSISTHA
jgi:3-mercaptopropionate dioxygenase